MGTVLADLRYAVRTLAKSPGFAAVAALTLALGIGANAAIFSVVDGVLLKPFAFADPERVVLVWSTQPEVAMAPTSPANFLDWRAQARSFERLAAARPWSFALTGAGEPELVGGAQVSAGFFRLLGVAPALGRDFLPAEDRPGAGRSALLSDRLFRRRFGGDPRVVGRALSLDGKPYTVVGVLPPGAPDLPADTELWVPIAFDAEEAAVRDTWSLTVLGRLAPGASLEQARAEMAAIARRLTAEHPVTNRNVGARVVPFDEMVLGDVRPALLVLAGAVGFVLLVACANVANLLLARAAARQREIAIRAALGAGRARLVRQLLTESLLLAGLGGIAGVLLAVWGVDLLATLGPRQIPRLDEAMVDARVLLFTLAVTLASGVVFGLAPALQGAAARVGETLKAGGAAVGGTPGRARTRSLLVVAEIALSLVLLAGAGLLAKSFVRLLAVDPGFQPRGALVAGVSLPAAKYGDGAARIAFYQRVLERVRSLPGVRAAAAGTDLPPWGGSSTGFEVEGKPLPPGASRPMTEYRVVTPGFFAALGIPLLSGRTLTERDGPSAPPVVVVNQALAQRFFPGEDPIGRRIGLSRPSDWREIVGVVADVKDYGLAAEARPTSYLPYEQSEPGYLAGVLPGLSLVVRAADPASLVPPLRRAVAEVDPDLPLWGVGSLEERLARSLSRQRFNAVLVGLFAGLGLLLAAVGIYGVISYAVAQRTREIGIRMALGAEGRDVLRLVVGQGLALALLGAGAGLLGALAIRRVLAGLLFDVSASDPAVLAGVSLLLVGVALLASALPALRAARLDPLGALKQE